MTIAGNGQRCLLARAGPLIVTASAFILAASLVDRHSADDCVLHLSEIRNRDLLVFEWFLFADEEDR